ncbi:hypothetical protein F5Y16DRAFT_399489 [Xylariaceae sp. FL0255]|nr:hypothetical protein F5Y16DRAFT_399489 [Xylariaceae sp. FL0255]
MGGKKQPSSKASSSKSNSSKNTSKRTNTKPHPPPSQSSTTTGNSATEFFTREELQRQQKLLDVFRTAFRDTLYDDPATFAARLQELKSALYNRDFAGAFQRGEAALDVYAARWSPTRALGYGRIFRGLDGYLRELFFEESYNGEDDGEGAGSEAMVPALAQDEAASLEPRVQRLEVEGEYTAGDSPSERQAAGGGKGEIEPKPLTQRSETLKVLAIGGAAAEIAAIADYVSSLGPNPNDNSTSRKASITLLDVGPWGNVVHKLQTSLTTPAPLPSYATPSAMHAANTAFISPAGYLTSTFIQQDILKINEDELKNLLLLSSHCPTTSSSSTPTPTPKPVLITLLFTLNELYTTSGLAPPTALLRLLTRTACPGTLLLVVDSPGSYSEAAVGKDANRYPMQWLLDHTLAGRTRTERENKKIEGGEQEKERIWERLESHDSIWFRVAEGLRYPIALENMRYQMHLYRLSEAG